MSASADLPSFARRTRHGLELDVSVIPNAKRTEVVGLHDGALRVRLHAPPVDGKANEALIRWLAEQLGVARASLSLLRGQTARRKTVSLATDASDARLVALLARLVPPAEG
ncbi:DUF167 domain-containing protein [Caldimonas thermodepolymerans]|uniref:UPF0235 protein C1702_11415 n=1 Tax=Caldimonas thermodepolymerans TaxID=215580 RepID=A0A2S5T3I1_9BURK|nr:DUF167 domain-containing protein [Caldimonas thermodepolymerans]PPE69540.1 DUF167 domain-containing protein [Caldimonas thermodepolymerans]QPC30944.1 DUF167 domain-containing protein [Caldimonas thermodepolymerans]RDH97042.1 hypothetical protein DES46_10960 [Caldimonas thermodepolymerans]